RKRNMRPTLDQNDLGRFGQLARPRGGMGASRHTAHDHDLRGAHMPSPRNRYSRVEGLEGNTPRRSNSPRMESTDSRASSASADGEGGGASTISPLANRSSTCDIGGRLRRFTTAAPRANSACSREQRKTLDGESTTAARWP